MRLHDLVGLDILAGLTYFDAEGQVLRQEQFFGVIGEADRGITWIRSPESGERHWVPTKVSAFRPAPGGTYRLATTGEVVTDPFLLTPWMLTVGQNEEGQTYYDASPNHAPLGQPRVPTEWELYHGIDADRIRRTIEIFGDEYIGRTLLLGVNYSGPDGELRRQEQLVGTIMVVDFDEGIVVSCEPESRTLVLPGDPAWVEKAPPAEYRLGSTGQVVTNPDYLAKVTIQQPA